ncbi:MAG TPA: type II secretion system F family protein [Acidimicrobiia bacterium]|jgi:tight adherence protein C
MTEMMFPIIAVGLATFAFFVWVGNGVVRARKANVDRLAVYGKDVLREETLAKPISERAIAPLVLGLGRFVNRFTPTGYMSKIQHKLVLAGGPGNMDASSFMVIKVITTVIGVVSAFFLRRFANSGMTAILMVAFPIVLGFFGPDAWLSRKVDERRETMRRALPDVLDLLVISVEAGLGFDSALARVVSTVPGPLSEEFFRMLQETRVGVSRRDAMRHLMDRTDLDELRSFLLAMMQAEAFGVAIARVLRVQADEMRVKRRQRAQEKAFAAPVKIVFPLVFCIFPTLFIVLLGPAAIQIGEAFQSTNG